MKIRLLIAGIVLASATGTGWAEPQIVACELVDLATATQLLSPPVEQHWPTPKRYTLPQNGGNASRCIFEGKLGTLYVELHDYSEARPVESRAEYMFKAISQRNDGPSVAVAGIGDEALWTSVGKRQYRYLVRKGPWVIALVTVWKEPTFGPRVRTQLAPIMESALLKL